MEFILKFDLVNYLFYAFDQILISNHNGEIGANGWIFENFDNKRQIQVLSLVIVSGHNLKPCEINGGVGYNSYRKF